MLSRGRALDDGEAADVLLALDVRAVGGQRGCRLCGFGIGLDPQVTTGHGGQRLSLSFYADDCDAAIEQLRSAGIQVIEEPVTHPWGERGARVLDPDGNEIVIGQRAS